MTQDRTAQLSTTRQLTLPDDTLHDRFRAWRDAHGELTLRAVGQRIGYSETAVSRYLSKTLAGDVSKVEDAIAELLKREERQSEMASLMAVKPFETEATRLIARTFEMILQDPQIGAAVGDAGGGKTSGIALYMETHPSALLFTASPLFGGGAHALLNALFRQIDSRAFSKARKTRGEFVVGKLAGSGRLLIIDDAHELHEQGRRAVKSFHDVTSCPVALVGNPRLIGQWSRDDQNGSRVGFVGEIRLFKKNAKGEPKDLRHLRHAVTQCLASVWPAAADDIADLALEVALREGHLRSLRLQCRLALRLVEMDKKHGHDLHTMAKERGITIAEQAFRTAHKQLVRSYELPA